MARIYPEFLGGPRAVGLLLLRLVTGVAFLFHGWGKITSPFDWMDKFGPSGYPSWLQACGAVAEFGGGIALILGALTPLACLGLAATMFVAAVLMHTIKFGDPFVSMDPSRPQSSELAFVYLAISLALLLLGPGKLSLDYCLFGRRRAATSPPV
jgi:putative oxidoreductase